VAFRVPYVRGRFTPYISLNWLEISKSTLYIMYPYMWTTIKAKISALLVYSAPSIVTRSKSLRKRFYLRLRISGNPEKSQIPNFQKNTLNELF
jgi:hypothetical protein